MEIMLTKFLFLKRMFSVLAGITEKPTTGACDTVSLNEVRLNLCGIDA
tara:strand:+ start:463 stop:606 length:144 start_codon:yes stop_codon:yes gene_type:complete